MDLRCKGAAALKLFRGLFPLGGLLWTEGVSFLGGRGDMKSPLPVLMQKYLGICIKNIYICKHILLYNYYTLYAYFIMGIIMHICILSFIYFNKRYIVHLYYSGNVCLFILVTAASVDRKRKNTFFILNLNHLNQGCQR